MNLYRRVFRTRAFGLIWAPSKSRSARLGLALALLVFALGTAAFAAPGAPAPATASQRHKAVTLADTPATSTPLVTRTFRLLPANPKTPPDDRIRIHIHQVVQAIRAYLYPPEEESTSETLHNARRRFVYDEARMQLTLADTPERLAKVEVYLAQLRSALGKGEARQTVRLQHQPAAVILKKVKEFSPRPAGRKAGLGVFTNITITTTAQLGELAVRAPDLEQLRGALQVLAMLDRPEKRFVIEALYLERKTTCSLEQESQAMELVSEWMAKSPDFAAAARGINANPVFRATALLPVTTSEKQPCLTRIELSHAAAVGTPPDSIELRFSVEDTSLVGGIMLRDLTITRSLGGRRSAVTTNVRLRSGGCTLFYPALAERSKGDHPDLLLRVRRTQ